MTDICWQILKTCSLAVSNVVSSLTNVEMCVANQTIATNNCPVYNVTSVHPDTLFKDTTEVYLNVEIHWYSRLYMYEVF